MISDREVLAVLEGQALPAVFKKQGFNPNACLPEALAKDLRLEVGYRVTQLGFLLPLWVEALAYDDMRSPACPQLMDIQLYSHKIYKRFLARLSPEDQQFFTACKAAVYKTIMHFCGGISMAAQFARKVVAEEMDSFNDMVKPLALPNRFVFLMLMKQLASQVHGRVIACVNELYPLLSADCAEQLASVAIEQHSAQGQESSLIAGFLDKLGILQGNICKLEHKPHAQAGH